MESHGRIICSVFYGKSDNVQEVLMNILSIYPRDPPRGGVIEFMIHGYPNTCEIDINSPPFC